MQKVLPEFRNKVEGAEVSPGTPAEFAATVQSDLAPLSKFVKQMNFKPDRGSRATLGLDRGFNRIASNARRAGNAAGNATVASYPGVTTFSNPMWCGRSRGALLEWSAATSRQTAGPGDSPSHERGSARGDRSA